MHATLSLLSKVTFPPIARRRTETLQVNLGHTCNQSCVHCHVNAGPTRIEMMDAATIETVIAFLRASRMPRLDLSGGAPELNPHFRHLVSEARKLGVAVIDRCNLTILQDEVQEHCYGCAAGLP